MIRVIFSIRQTLKGVSIRQKVLFTVLVMLTGLALGFIAKATDSVSLLGDIGTDLGIWVFIATIITAFSHTPLMAMLNAPVFFLSVLVSYYLYGHFVLGFFPKAYFIGWLIISLISPAGGLLSWLSQGKGWIANVCASLPVSILFACGYPAYYTFNITHILDVLYAVVLLIILPKTLRDRGIVLAISCIIAFYIARFNLLLYLPW